MKRWVKILAVVMGVMVLTSIAGVGVIFANNNIFGPRAPLQAGDDAYLAKLAARLNVTVDALKATFTSAQLTTLDQLVAQGRITAEQKQAILDRTKNFPVRGLVMPLFGKVTTTTGQTPVNEMYLSNLAAALNTTVDGLKAAAKQAEIDIVNDLFAQGKITEQQKERMLAAIEKGPNLAPQVRKAPQPPVNRLGPAKTFGFPGSSAFLDKLAANLGITRQALDDAVKKTWEDLKAAMPGRTPRPSPTPNATN